MKISTYIKILAMISGLFYFNVKYIDAEVSYSYNELPFVAGAKIDISELPSALWPTFVKASEDIMEDGVRKVRKGARGVLQRCEGNNLIVDFGRDGVVTVPVSETDFVESVSDLLKGEVVKDFPNMTIQIGNKLITFGEGDLSGIIHMDKVRDTGVFIFLYLDTYDPEQAKDLYQFGLAYEDLKENYPNIMAVIMPIDYDYYNFGYTAGYKVPYITPHLRKGYIDSFQHQPPSYPHLLLTDPNGRILYRSKSGLTFKKLSKELQIAVQSLAIDWQPPRNKTFIRWPKLLGN